MGDLPSPLRGSSLIVQGEEVYSSSVVTCTYDVCVCVCVLNRGGGEGEKYGG